MSGIKQLKLEAQLDELEKDLSLLSKKLEDHDNVADRIIETYRKIHNLKSNLFLVDSNESLKLTYLMEVIFDKFRTGLVPLSEKALEMCAGSIQWIGNDLKGSPNKSGLHESLMTGLKNLQNPDEKGALTPRKLNLTTDEKALLKDARNSNLNIYMIELSVDRSMSREDFRDLPLLNEISRIGVIVLQTPAYINWNEAAPGDRILIKVVFVTDQKLKDFDEPLLKNAVPFEEDLYISHQDYKILIVEDNPVALLLQKSIMGAFGVCDTVRDGESGLELFKLSLEEKSPYQIILLDLVMPGIGGSEVLKQIRELERSSNIKGLDRCRVIVSTTTKESSTLMDLFRAEADAYIFKPLTKDKITREMKNLKLI